MRHIKILRIRGKRVDPICEPACKPIAASYRPLDCKRIRFNRGQALVYPVSADRQDGIAIRATLHRSQRKIRLWRTRNNLAFKYGSPASMVGGGTGLHPVPETPS